MDERQGRRATVAYLTANLHKKDDGKRAIEPPCRLQSTSTICR
jgi:hypothetical protein